MKPKTQLIFKNKHYAACVLADQSLVVTKNGKQSGVRIVGTEAIEWADSISTAMDSSEASSLCKALLSNK